LDGTVLWWDVSAAWPRRHTLRRRLSEAQWEALWADLASTDAVRGRSALGALVAAPAFTVGRLRGQLRPVPSVKRRVDALIERLPPDSFPRGGGGGGAPGAPGGPPGGPRAGGPAAGRRPAEAPGGGGRR